MIDNHQHTQTTGGLKVNHRIGTMALHGKVAYQSTSLDVLVHLLNNVYCQVLLQGGVLQCVALIREIIGIHAGIVADIVNWIEHHFPQQFESIVTIQVLIEVIGKQYTINYAD